MRRLTLLEKSPGLGAADLRGNRGKCGVRVVNEFRRHITLLTLEIVFLVRVDVEICPARLICLDIDEADLFQDFEDV